MVLVRRQDFPFHPVHLLGVAQTLQMGRVIRIVIRGGHRAQLVIAPGEHPFGVHVGEPERPHKLVASMGTPPCLHRLQQGTTHLPVVHEIDPTETGVVRPPCLVGLMIDDGGHPPHDFPVAQGQEEIGLTKVEGRVFPGIERVERVFQEIGHGIRTILVKLVVEADKGFQLAAGGYFLYCYSRHHDIHLLKTVTLCVDKIANIGLFWRISLKKYVLLALLPFF